MNCGFRDSFLCFVAYLGTLYSVILLRYTRDAMLLLATQYRVFRLHVTALTYIAPYAKYKVRQSVCVFVCVCVCVCALYKRT